MTPDTDGTVPEIDVSAYGRTLVDSVISALPTWSREVLNTRVGPTSGASDSEVLGLLVNWIEAPLTDLLTADIDAQRESPLALLRALITPLTDILRSLGATEVERDPYDNEAFPNDVYALGPRAWSDFGESVGDAGLRWGAAKAMAHRRRHATPNPTKSARR